MIDPVLRRPPLQGLARFFTHPVVAGIIFTTTVGIWHAPWLYDLALQDKVVHVVEHLMFFGGAVLYWWPMLSPSRVLPPIPYAAQLLYLIAVIIGMTPVFAYITFSQDILYPTYEFAPRLFPNFSAVDDQLLAGVIMKIVGMFVAMGAFLRAFYLWYQEKK
ncbi:MAG: cytochrome c oxidase assembly protein, partial [Opitutus sp.]